MNYGTNNFCILYIVLSPVMAPNLYSNKKLSRRQSIALEFRRRAAFRKYTTFSQSCKLDIATFTVIINLFTEIWQNGRV